MDTVVKGLSPNNLRYLLYLVTPNETTYPTQDSVPNFTDQVGCRRDIEGSAFRPRSGC